MMPGGAQYGAPGWYGSNSSETVQMGRVGEKGPFMSSRRQRMNVVPMLLCMFFPWCLFATVFGTVSFSIHYQQPAICWCVVLVALLIVVIVGAFTAKERIRIGRDAPTERQPSWWVFMFIALVLAWFLAMGMGQTNYYNNLKPYYDYLNLNTYHDIYPNRIRGQQIMDAGAIVFTAGTHLEVKRSQGFKNGGVYCVAPIVFGNQTMATYDFWAVGQDCCSGTQADFHCAGFNDPLATGALRLMRDDARPFYRLAVQQAEATYDIKAVHPLFFHWVRDVTASVESWHEAGWQLYLAGVFTHFLVQAFIVGAASVAFSKLGRF